MKISYRTHPIIDRLEKGKLGRINIKEEDFPAIEIHKETIRTSFINLANNKFSFYCLTTPFIDAFHQASSKLMDSALWAHIPSGSYCFLYQADGVSIDVKNDNESGIIDCRVCALSRSKNEEDPLLDFIGEITIFYDVDKNDEGKIRTNGFTGFESFIHKQSYKVGVTDRLCTYLMMVLFTKYADIQIKYLPANKKVKELDCKYVNDTASNIQILDSTWFTTLVKSDAFKVRGHFRLQPCGEGLKNRKLIWINDFEKKGYSRTATIIKEAP